MTNDIMHRETPFRSCERRAKQTLAALTQSELNPRMAEFGEPNLWKTTRKLLVSVAIPFIIIALPIGYLLAMRLKYSHERANWQAATLPRLAGLSMTNTDIRRELERLKKEGSAGAPREWVGEHVLLMTNGECLLCAFRHGFNNGSVEHLFLAHGSDGRWLYSTYHFCHGMAATGADDPPGSITEFAMRYSAREFDGKSDVCLQHTWPPGR
jgi:hypothetical protein